VKARNDAPPPPITIVDPQGGTRTTEVLDSRDDTDPWRPSMRQVVVLLLVVLVTATASIPFLVVHQRDQRLAADRAELASLGLTQHENDDVFHSVTDSGIPLALENTSPYPLVVLSAHVDREGYQDQTIGTTIPRRRTGTVALAPLGACPPKAAVPASPSGVQVTVRTPRGQRTTVRVSVRDSFFSDSYAQAIRERCGAYPVEESFVATVRDVQRSGPAVTGHLLVRNRAKVTRTLTSLSAGEGLTLILGRFPPIDVPPGRDALEVDVPFSIRIENCRRTSPQLTGKSDPYSNAPGQDYYPLPGFGEISATGRDGSLGATFPLVFSEELTSSLRDLVAATCPHNPIVSGGPLISPVA
jgi:hypothetical protein